METSILASIFALSAAFIWGSGDFTSGMVARRIGPFNSLLASYVVGSLGLTSLALIVHQPFPGRVDLLWGAIAGLFGTVGFLFMLRGFAVGRMGVVAPVSSVLAAAIPVMVAAFTVGLPSQVQLFGFALAFISIWLLSRQQGDEARPSGFGLALLAGLGFGAFFIGLDQISAGTIFWPLVAGRVVPVTLMGAFALFTRRQVLPANSPKLLIVLAGLLDVGGNFFFLHALQTGRLDIAAVLVSLYPGVTVILARLITKEHLSRLQVFAVGLAILAIMLITI